MTITYTDVLKSMKHILEANAWPEELYVSEDTQGEWLDDDRFVTQDEDVSGEVGELQPIEVRTGEDERLVGHKDNGEKVTISVPP